MKLSTTLIQQHTLHPVEIFETIPSTHDYLKNLSPEKIHSPIHICLAEHQSAGHGRFARKWISPAEANIYLSCRWKNTNLKNISGLSLVVGLAIISTLQKYGVQDCYIKWPNDILYYNKKLAGVLIDITPNAIIISLGLNVNMADIDMKNIDKPWTSLEKIIGEPQDRNKIVGLLINDLFKKNNLDCFMNEWKKVDYLFNKKITLDLNLDNKNKISGICRGINNQGLLLLEDEHGEINKYSAGEVSISV
jgi:BirA family biotin operon repressor/biotin-[acetyl-CoA-carboxylase] ligase